MLDFGRQGWLDGQPFATLAQAIEHKKPEDTLAIISFDKDVVEGQPRPPDLMHDEIEQLRDSAEFQA